MPRAAKPPAPTKSAAEKPAKKPRAKSAFMFFCAAERPKILAQTPDLKFTEVGKQLGERWRALDEAGRAPFEAAAAQDRAALAAAQPADE